MMPQEFHRVIERTISEYFDSEVLVAAMNPRPIEEWHEDIDCC